MSRNSLVVIIVVLAVFSKTVLLPFMFEHFVAWPFDETIGIIDLPKNGAEGLRHAYENKRVLVVGGTRGVGLGFSQAVARAGAYVTVVGRSETAGKIAVENIGENASFLQGDIGSVASAKATVAKIEEVINQEGNEPFDYLAVTAAVFPNWSGRTHQQEDGIDIPFAVAVVGRYIIYKNMPKFIKQDARILNVLASGEMKCMELDRELATGQRDPSNLFESLTTFGCGSELMMQLVDTDPELKSFTRVSTHPGFLKTDLHRGQGLLFDMIESLFVTISGISIEDCGVEQASILASSKLHPKSLSFVSSDRKGRLASASIKAFTAENLPWLEGLLQTLS